MTNIDSNEIPQPKYMPLKWGHEAINNVDVPGRVLLTFAARVEAIASGGHTIMEIAETYHIDKESIQDDAPASKPYFNDYHISNMLGLVKASLDLLSSEAYDMEKWAYEQHTKEGAIERYRAAAYSLKSKGVQLPVLD